jgi:hypothetical protein
MQLNAIAIIVKTGDTLLNQLVKCLYDFIKLDMENNTDKKVLSNQTELEVKKRTNIQSFIHFFVH